MSTWKFTILLILAMSVTWTAMIAVEFPVAEYRGDGDGTIEYVFPVYRDNGNFAPMHCKSDYVISESEYRNAFESRMMRCNSVFFPAPEYLDDGACVRAIADELNTLIDAQPHRYTELEKAKVVQMFVRSAVDYVSDEEQYGMIDYIAYSVETLYTGKGDCEDVAILYVSVALAMGLDAKLLGMTGHVCAGVRIADFQSEHKVGDYTMVECTGRYPDPLYSDMGGAGDWKVLEPSWFKTLGAANDGWRRIVYSILGV